MTPISGKYANARRSARFRIRVVRPAESATVGSRIVHRECTGNAERQYSVLSSQYSVLSSQFSVLSSQLEELHAKGCLCGSDSISLD
jgi:hypothetical protein